MRLDHVSYVASPGHLADVTQRLGSALGGAFADGGLHPRFGTRNFLLPLAGGMYLEVVSTLDHPAADRAPFGQAVKARALAGGGWLGWVVAVDDITVIEQRLGRPAVDGNRHRPDGFDLQWRQLGINDLMADPSLPFFTQWLCGAEEHPSNGAHAGIRIERMEICGDPEKVSTWLGEPSDHPLDDIEVDWVDGDDAGVVSITFATRNGSVRLD